MSRIRKVYEVRFRALLQRVRARRLEPGVQWLLNRAVRLSQTEGISLTHALIRVHGLVAERIDQCEGPSGQVRRGSIVFLCDAGLGGLARWLRAAGHETIWNPALDDDALLREAACLRATVVTTDSLLMERRVLRDGLIPAFWVPPTLKVPEQLALVFREFGLTLREPRCMRCGGELLPVDKETMRERIPPRTWRWLDEYFVCSRCDQLFWKGTHWRRIGNQLSVLQAKA
jgi:uncharacterized protein with PIN domain